ncbi:MAG: alpha/beta hydrolase [Candidatus Nanopelagicales bacterium]
MPNSSSDLPEGIESIRFAANGLEVHALAAGPADGPLVMLLHGFPELSRSWRHQLVALSNAGYRAVAPDQRGYGQTTRRGPYDIETLSADVAAMIDALGRERAIVIGHDWGGGVAWAVAGFFPQRVQALVVANCPPPQVMARALKRSPRQLKKSLYMVFFQLPVIPERMLTADGSRAIGRSLVGGSYVRSAFDEVRDQDLPGRIQRTGRRLGRARLVPSCDASSTLGSEVESYARQCAYPDSLGRA